MNVFDIIGPVMIGPSSSHTAGAVRIGRIASVILGKAPVRADISLYGSFAKTYKGHGTDKAVVGGLLGYEVDDLRIPDSLKTAAGAGMEVSFHEREEESYHPNTVRIDARSGDGKRVSMTAASLGGGQIAVRRLDDIEVDFNGEYTTVVIRHEDKPGVVSDVTDKLADAGINIAFMRVFRKIKGHTAIMVIETDQRVGRDVEENIERVEHVLKTSVIGPVS